MSFPDSNSKTPAEKKIELGLRSREFFLIQDPQLNTKKSDFVIYKYQNKCVITSIKIKRVKFTKKIYMIVNDVKLPPTESTKQYWIWDIRTIRDNIFELDPETDEDVLLKRLENTFVYNGLRSIQFYSNVSNEELKSSIFTDELDIKFMLHVDTNYTSPKKIEAIEHYFQSDVHSSE
jgi:hypothetical protein